MSFTLPRRTLLRGALGLGAAAGLTGCGAPALKVPETAARGTPRAGGVMRIARPAASAAETLLPASSLSAYEYLGAIFNRVVRLDDKGQTVPDLATEWDSNRDATEWTFRLREGVQFHDGKPLTSADVAYTMRVILDPDTASPQAGTLKTMFAPRDIETPDDLTVRFKLKTANAEFPSLLTAYQCYIIPEDSADTVGQTGIGTGPFKLESYRAAGYGAVVAHEDYFDGPPVLDRIEFYSIQDTSARVNALLSRQVDLLSQTNMDNATARVVTGSAGVTVARVPNAQWYTIPMLATSREFKDPLVRQAMKLAYDPEVLLQTALQGTGSPGWDNPVPPTMAGRLGTDRAYDPEQARALLKKAGRGDFEVRIHTSAYEPNLTPVAIAYADQVKQAGVNLVITNVSADSFYTTVWMQKPLMVSYWYTGRPIDQLLNQIFRSGSSYNESAWSNKQFDQLLDAARADTNDASRQAKYEDAQQLIVDDGADMTPIFGDRLVGLSQDVVNYTEYGFEFDYINLGFKE